ALVYLPPQYFQPKYAQSTFPVVQVFTGYPGDVRQIVDRIKYPNGLLTAMKARSAQPMILVFLNPTLAPPRDTECTNVPGGPQVATYFLHDVPTVLREHLRVTAAGWGLMGHSTGGYCATKLAMMSPKLFTTVVSLSGNYTAVRDGQTKDLWGGSKSFRDLNDPQWRMTNLPVPQIALLASVGSLEKGSDGVSATRRFFATIRAPFVGKLIVVNGGAHNFADYRQVLPQAFSWLSQHLTPGSTPQG
ncbi:MAG: alpha/beta hydrolase-fold protein, partial [Allobranchiibius sp.]